MESSQLNIRLGGSDCRKGNGDQPHGSNIEGLAQFFKVGHATEVGSAQVTSRTFPEVNDPDYPLQILQLLFVILSPILKNRQLPI